MERGFKPRGLGEIALRCADMVGMVAFYRDVIGLEVLRGTAEEPIVFFKIGEGVAGHTTVLALFHHSLGARGHKGPPEAGSRSSLHHIALSLPWQEQEAVVAHYEALGQPYRIETFEWAKWRGIFTEDPEGNTVELVAYDPAVG